MGVDWIKVKEENIKNREKLNHLIFNQSKYFPINSVDKLIGELLIQRKTNIIDENIRSSNYRKSRDELKTIFQLPSEIDYWSLDKNQITRVGILVNNPIFPIEWRIEALSTLTNQKLSTLLSKWTNFIQEVKIGKHREYHYQLLSYLNQEILIQSSNELIFSIQKSYELNNAWTKKVNFINIREKIQKQGIQSFSKLEIPVFKNSTNKVDSIILNGYQNQLKKGEILKAKVLSWNKNVSSKWKCFSPHLNKIESFIEEHLNNKSLMDFFDWCEKSIKENYALFLDY